MSTNEFIERDLTDEEVVASVNQDYATKYGFADTEDYVFKAEKGLNPEMIRAMSKMKNEPEWMLDIRLKAYQHFLERPMPQWGSDLSGIKFEDIYYYIKPSERQGDTWEDANITCGPEGWTSEQLPWYKEFIVEAFEKLETGLPASYVKYYLDRLTGLAWEPILVDGLVVVISLAALGASVWLNVRDWQGRSSVE